MCRYVMESSVIGQNIEVLKRHAGKATIWGVVKGNGYGLGTLQMANVLKEHGVRHFAVAEVSEARELRENGFVHEPILMLRGTANPDEVKPLLEMGVILTISSAADLQAARDCHIPGQAHIKIDTGLGRFGFLPEQMSEILSCFSHSYIFITGIYTHFSSAYSDHKTRKQFAAFQEVVEALRDRGIDPGMVHCCNSAAFWYHPEMHMDGVRLGSALLGRVGFAEEAGLRPAGYCLAKVSEIRELPKNSPIGYNGAYRTRRVTETAVVDVGHLHGFCVENARDTQRPRDCVRDILHAVSRFVRRRAIYVDLNGHPCRVLGHIGMNTTVIDVTDCPCRVGDPVRLEINPLHINHLQVVSEGA